VKTYGIATVVCLGIWFLTIMVFPGANAQDIQKITVSDRGNITEVVLPVISDDNAMPSENLSENTPEISGILLKSASISALESSAQPRAGIEWQKVMGSRFSEEFASIRETDDGGYIACGMTGAYNAHGDVNPPYRLGNGDAWIVKLDSAGNTTWQNISGGRNRDECRSIRQTSDGGFVFVGFSNSSDEFTGPNNGEYDIFVVKLDNSGKKVWQRLLGGEYIDAGTSIRETSDGGYILTGFEDFSPARSICSFSQQTNAWVMKLKPDGSLDWQKKFTGDRDVHGTSIIEARDGDYVVYGFTSSTSGDGISGNHGVYDLWVMKMDPTGQIIRWSKLYGGSGFEATGHITDDGIQQTSDGGFVLVGQETSDTTGDGPFSNIIYNHGGSDIWIVKLNPEGTLQWQKAIGGNRDEIGGRIYETADGGYIITARTESSNSENVGENHGDWDIWVAKLGKPFIDENGLTQVDIIWQDVLGGSDSDHCLGMDATEKGGYIISGRTMSNSSGDVGFNHGGNGDSWVIKLKPRYRFDIIDSDSQQYIPNATVELFDYLHKESQIITSYTGVIQTERDGPVIFTDSGTSHQYLLTKGQKYKINISIEGYPFFSNDFIFQNDGQRERIMLTAYERPLELSYSITGAMNPGGGYDNLWGSSSDSDISYIEDNLNKRLNWKPVFVHYDEAITKDDFALNGGGLNDATIHFHLGHGVYDLFVFGKTKLVLSNGESLHADEVKGKWGNKNKWVYLSSCNILDDLSWEDAMNTTHGIFGYKTRSKTGRISPFIDYTMKRDTLAHSFQRTIETHDTDERISVVIFSNRDQLLTDHLPSFGSVAPDEYPNDGNYEIQYFTGMMES